jgi:predicted aldo/keto reductase-like oxidoreductase
MLKRNYKSTDLSISVLGLGCMRLPKVSPDKEDIDFEKAQEMVDYALAHGINYIDTAYPYHGGTSEEFVGKALKKHDRSSFFLATKFPIWLVKSPDDVEHYLNIQLKRLQTDYIDFYLVHALNIENFNRCKEFGVYDLLKKKKKEGVIRHLGFSFHDVPDVLEEICDAYEWDFAQLQLNYLDWEMQDAKRQYEILARHNIPCIVMEPVRGGTLASPCDTANELFKAAKPDKSVASWAIRYAANLPNVMTVLSGMSNMEQLLDNINTMTDFEPLTNNDYSVIENAVDAYKTKDTIPCTGCRYCMECPSGVDIPKMFKLYNQYAVDKDKEAYKAAYDQTEELERPENCVACGLCTQHCPQAIKIPEKLIMIKDLTKELFA